MVVDGDRVCPMLANQNRVDTEILLDIMNGDRQVVPRRTTRVGFALIACGIMSVVGCKGRSDAAAVAETSTPPATSATVNATANATAPTFTVTATDFAFDAPAE